MYMYVYVYSHICVYINNKRVTTSSPVLKSCIKYLQVSTTSISDVNTVFFGRMQVSALLFSKMQSTKNLSFGHPRLGST